jgi:hypothetical protein
MSTTELGAVTWDQIDDELMQEYLLCADIAFAVLLLLITIYAMVLKQYSPKKIKFNKLSMRPYYTVICYSVFCILQFSLSLVLGDDEIFLLGFLVNINKLNFMYLAIAFQLFEWFNAWRIMDF